MRVGSLLLCGSWELNSGCWDWQQAPLLAELSLQSLKGFLNYGLDIFYQIYLPFLKISVYEW